LKISGGEDEIEGAKCEVSRTVYLFFIDA